MSPAYWDPANLLQIAFNVDDAFGEIQCVGLTSRHNNRCRWTIEEPNQSEIRSLLAQMSKTKPGLIKTDTLHQLAGLCLCPSFHAAQVYDVTTRWNTIVKAAAQHHKNLAESLGSAPPGVDPRLQLALERANLELGKSQDLVGVLQRRLDEENSAAAQFAARTHGSINELRLEVSSWKDRAQQSEADKKSQELTTANLQKSIQALDKDLKKGSADIERAEKEISLLREKVQEATSQLQTCQTERAQDQKENQILQSDINQARTDQARQSEIDKNEKEIQQSTIFGLQQSNRALEESLKNETAKRERAEEEISGFQTELQQADDQLQDHQTEINQTRRENQNLQSQVEQVRKDQKSSAEIFEKLQIESCTSQEMVQKSAADFEAEMHRCHTDMERQRTRIFDLEKNIGSLKITETKLKESISACWLHGFGIWTGGFLKKGSKRKDDIALSTSLKGNNLV
ncbi:hypothetical protein G7Z17_g1736 [Cylindrodendrum hubeiense]|uniref:Uncharacterized protein n=1 Tax=Cylindrodendrum hubeiense TaxID=595255 RepID=A0A9P5LLS8_9HYPO|nr:hypothetical protein G7Z17_g1736 [Cylindrodendrum hubeiense]